MMNKVSVSFCLFLALTVMTRGIFCFTLDHVSVSSSSGHEHPAPLPPKDALFRPLCGCVVRGQCADTLRSFTDLVLRTKASELVCGSKTELCCYKDDPWPGVIDQFSHQAPCRPDNECVRVYGTSATDVRDFGAIGPCPGLGSVRCLDGFSLPPPAPVSVPLPVPAPLPVPVPLPAPLPEVPPHYVIPIIPEPQPLPQPPPVFIPHPPPPTTPQPTTPPPTTPPTGYEYPPNPAPVYEPPVSVEEPPPPPPSGGYKAPTPQLEEDLPRVPLAPLGTNYGVPITTVGGVFPPTFLQFQPWNLGFRYGFPYAPYYGGLGRGFGPPPGGVVPGGGVGLGGLGIGKGFHFSLQKSFGLGKGLYF